MSTRRLEEDFRQWPSDHWQRHETGQGSLEWTGSTLRLINTDTSQKRYSNAQIDDYFGLPRCRFLWRPPLKLTVRARFSHPGPELRSGVDCDCLYQPTPDGGPILSGTAGFGFWNDPFLMTERRLPTLPRAIWFFYASPPSNMKLDLDTPGCGWKAATIDALRWPFFLLAPTMPVSVPLMTLPSLYRRLWPIGQRAIAVNEARVEVDMTTWHTYEIEWGVDTARFLVDGQVVLDCCTPPRGPLGLVIWLDNQYMVVTPWGRLRHGLLAQPGCQWLELDWVRIE